MLIYSRGIFLGIIRIVEEISFLKEERLQKKKRLNYQSLKKSKFISNQNVAFLSSSLNNILVCCILKGITLSIRNYNKNKNITTLKEMAEEHFTYCFREVDLIEPRLFEKIIIEKAIEECDTETVFGILS